ncbi:MAG: hypothetical protein R6U17_09465 [Thermoplasmata archaeon]
MDEYEKSPQSSPPDEGYQQPPPQDWGKQAPPPEQPPQQQQQWQEPPPQQYQQPPSTPMFSAEGIQKTLGMMLLIGVVIILVGSILVAASGYIERDSVGSMNLARNLNATGILLGAVGLSLPAMISSFAIFSIKDLSEKQIQMLVFVIGASLVGFAVLINAVAVL